MDIHTDILDYIYFRHNILFDLLFFYLALPPEKKKNRENIRPKQNEEKTKRW